MKAKRIRTFHSVPHVLKNLKPKALEQWSRTIQRRLRRLRSESMSLITWRKLDLIWWRRWRLPRRSMKSAEWQRLSHSIRDRKIHKCRRLKASNHNQIVSSWSPSTWISFSKTGRFFQLRAQLRQGKRMFRRRRTSWVRHYPGKT